ncbi:hypothetical protein [Kitasatospora sp. NPDC058046]|uniref:hypothetical protein n=1 Tax=Kitasatospora sp. NPDC058046 TaxID=3346312 RepID=UPI0036D99645
MYRRPRPYRRVGRPHAGPVPVMAADWTEVDEVTRHLLAEILPSRPASLVDALVGAFALLSEFSRPAVAVGHEDDLAELQERRARLAVAALDFTAGVPERVARALAGAAAAAVRDWLAALDRVERAQAGLAPLREEAPTHCLGFEPR